MMSPNPIDHVSRRSLLKGSVAGIVLLGIGAHWPQRRTHASGMGWYADGDPALIRALAASMLRGSLPAAGAERDEGLDLTVAGVERAIMQQPSHVRDELRDLFDLLQLAPARLLMCGFWSPWDQVAVDDVDDCLTSWRNSRLELLRLAYLSLQELIVASYFMQPMAWARIGFDGPPDVERPVRRAP